MQVPRPVQVLITAVTALAVATGLSSCGGDGDDSNNKGRTGTATSTQTPAAPTPTVTPSLIPPTVESSPTFAPPTNDGTAVPRCDVDGTKPKNAVAENFADRRYRADYGKKVLSSDNRTMRVDSRNGDTSVVWAGGGTDPIANGYQLRTRLTFDVQEGGARAWFGLLADGEDPVYGGGELKASLFVAVETGPSGGTLYYGSYGNSDQNRPGMDVEVKKRGLQALLEDPNNKVATAPYEAGTPLDVSIITGSHASIAIKGYQTVVIPPELAPDRSMFVEAAAREADGGASQARMEVTAITMQTCVNKTVTNSGFTTDVNPEAVRSAVNSGSYAATQVTSVETRTLVSAGPSTLS